MEADKKYVGGWWVWIGVLVVITGIVAAGLNYAGLIGKTFVERKVFEQSYQRSESMKSAAKTYRAELSILRARMDNPKISEETRASLQAQIDAISILKSTKENY